jgi:hypothetical protein
MARFEVLKVFRLSLGPSIVFAGRILEGTVRSDMWLRIEGRSRPLVTCQVKSVEFLDRPSVGEYLVALRCAESNLEDVGLCMDLCPPGTVIDVVDGEPNKQNSDDK